MNRTVMAALAGALLAVAVAGCEREGPAERAGERIDEAVQGAGEELERAGEKLDEAAREAGEKLEEAGESVQERVGR